MRFLLENPGRKWSQTVTHLHFPPGLYVSLQRTDNKAAFIEQRGARRLLNIQAKNRIATINKATIPIISRASLLFLPISSVHEGSQRIFGRLAGYSSSCRMSRFVFGLVMLKMLGTNSPEGAHEFVTVLCSVPRNNMSDLVSNVVYSEIAAFA